MAKLLSRVIPSSPSDWLVCAGVYAKSISVVTARVLWSITFTRAGALDVEDPPVRGDGQLERVGQVLRDQRHPLELAVLGGAAVTGDRAGRPLDARSAGGRGRTAR